LNDAYISIRKKVDTYVGQIGSGRHRRSIGYPLLYSLS
jgi:hypothetical protein